MGLRRAERGGLSKPSLHLHGLTNGPSAVRQRESSLGGVGGGADFSKYYKCIHLKRTAGLEWFVSHVT